MPATLVARRGCVIPRSAAGPSISRRGDLLQSPKFSALAALAMFAVAACGGSSTASSGAAAPTAAPSAATTTSSAPSAAPAGGASQAPAAASALAPAAQAAALCALFSAADLKTATGDAYGAGVPDEFGMCTWRVGGATSNNGKGQIIAAIQDQPLATFKSTFPGGTDLTVSGHAAYWNPSQGLQSLWVDVNGRTLVLSLDPVGTDSQAIAQKLAELAVGKM
jgi:Protein of unknown function (DUF3558)